MGGTHDFFDMFVPMHMDLNTQSFYAPNDGYTRVTENYWNSGFTDPAEAGGLLAHEEIHHLGWDGPEHNTGEADEAQQSCSVQ
jgi:hypothetical protein